MSRDSARTPAAAEPGVLVHTRADRELATAHWLLSAHPEPSRARAEWSQHGGMVLLPLGTLFSAVRIPERLVHAVADSEDPAAVDAFLAEALHGGPVICDPRGRRYYALVPASTAARWRQPEAECLGRETYLGVPRLDAVELSPQAWASYWSVPMPSPAELCSPEAVAQLVVLGSFRTAEEGPE
ncbi:hypothetical protein ACFPH6_45955 [Streptomyces xiangluensis]|uniref:Bifunctional DNA primase/polymerase, N-terminal n=1 Tax=Streptomyces xiangluensis TaxID=2665720 RepID=A0ABV8Z2Q6_9ACTN